MRRMTLLAALAALVLSAPVAKAEGMTFGLQGGMAVPMGDFSDGFGPGPQGGVFGDLWLNPQFALGADIVGNFHKAGGDYKDAIEAAGGSADDVKFSIIQFGVHGKWKPALGEAPAAPWLQLGAGMYAGRAEFKSGTEDISESSSKFGFDVGAGVDFPMNEALKLGVNAHLHTVPDAIETFDPSTFESAGTKSAQYFSIGVSLTFSTSGGN